MADALRLGVVVTHPVQYHAPLFRALAAVPDVELTVLFAHRPTPTEQGAGFGVPFEWDVDLTSGYRHEWLRNVARAPSVSSFAGCDTPDVARAIAERRFEAVLVAGWHSRSYWQAIAACWRMGIPVMVRGDSQLDPEEAGRRRLVKRLLYPRFISRFAACLSVGTRSDEYFNFYGARRVVRSPHFVDNEFFASRAEHARGESRALRRSFGIGDEDVVCLFAGKLIAKKRPLDVVRAAARARESGVPVKLLVAGDGELRAQCEAEAGRLAVPCYVLGFLNQTRMPVAYAAADVVALASDSRETWGLVVNEAMACGVPGLVSSAAGCSPDLVIEGITGFTFPLGDVERFAHRLAKLAADPGQRRHMGAAARAHVSTFSADAAAAGVIDATRAVARRRPS